MKRIPRQFYHILHYLEDIDACFRSKFIPGRFDRRVLSSKYNSLEVVIDETNKLLSDYKILAILTSRLNESGGAHCKRYNITSLLRLPMTMSRMPILDSTRMITLSSCVIKTKGKKTRTFIIILLKLPWIFPLLRGFRITSVS